MIGAVVSQKYGNQHNFYAIKRRDGDLVHVFMQDKKTGEIFDGNGKMKKQDLLDKWGKKAKEPVVVRKLSRSSETFRGEDKHKDFHKLMGSLK